MPRVGFETEDYVTVMSFVANGLGIALVPGLIMRTTSHPDVVTVPIEPASRRTVYAVTTPDLQRVPAVATTLEALCSSSRAAGGHGICDAD